ncbi:MAG: hypothetical protein ACOVO2_11690 [Emticicia sp.]|uniref:hypothetical protein n=1 Tax=Emticicia sp. TaxID=1930953 RepID=UPI003BA49BE4
MKKSLFTAYLFLLFFSSVEALGTIIVLNGLTHQYSSSIGSVITGRIKLKNDGNSTEKFVAYKQDMLFYCGKNEVFSATEGHGRSLKNWLKTSIDERVLTAGEEYDLTYTINIPRQTDTKGTYWVVIMIEPGEPVSRTEKTGLNITSKVRYAVQILVDVGTFESPKMTFEDVNLKKSQISSRLVEVQLKNEGQFAVRTKLQLEIYNAQGQKIKTLETHSRRVFPEKCSNFEIEVSDLPKGKYDGVLVADNGKNLVGSNLTIEIE